VTIKSRTRGGVRVGSIVLGMEFCGAVFIEHLRRIYCQTNRDLTKIHIQEWGVTKTESLRVLSEHAIAWDHTVYPD
jgi:hypothetical protein